MGRPLQELRELGRSAVEPCERQVWFWSCLKPPRLWQFVTTALGIYCKDHPWSLARLEPASAPRVLACPVGAQHREWRKEVMQRCVTQGGGCTHPP